MTVMMATMMALCTLSLRRDMHLLPQLASSHQYWEQFVHIPLSHFLASNHHQLT